MKIGIVFGKLAARAQVESISFGETVATITLKAPWNVDGATTHEAATAHIARLWIESATGGDVTRKPRNSTPATPAVIAPAPVVAKALPSNVIALDGRRAASMAFDAGDNKAAALAMANSTVAVTPRTAALLIVAKVLARAA